MVRLHALQSVSEESLALEIHRAVLCGDGTLRNTARPEGVSHRSPWVLEVGAVQSCSCGSGLETRCRAGDLEVDDGVGVVHALDGVVGAILGQLDRAVIGVETRLVLVEVVVVEGCRGPEVGLGRV